MLPSKILLGFMSTALVALDTLRVTLTLRVKEKDKTLSN